MGTIYHIQAGTETWDPTPEEIAKLKADFESAVLTTESGDAGVFATRAGVHVTAIETYENEGSDDEEEPEDNEDDDEPE